MFDMALADDPRVRDALKPLNLAQAYQRQAYLELWYVKSISLL
jgi:hypothetical protein